jgi:hypothetical protein
MQAVITTTLHIILLVKGEEEDRIVILKLQEWKPVVVMDVTRSVM